MMFSRNKKKLICYHGFSMKKNDVICVNLYKAPMKNHYRKFSIIMFFFIPMWKITLSLHESKEQRTLRQKKEDTNDHIIFRSFVYFINLQRKLQWGMRYELYTRSIENISSNHLRCMLAFPYITDGYYIIYHSIYYRILDFRGAWSLTQSLILYNVFLQIFSSYHWMKNQERAKKKYHFIL